jgi:hypothetical protein
MPIFSLEALPAHKGDCLILHYGEGSPARLILIDGGPSNTYQPHLRPRLEELRAERGLGDLDSLDLEMLMVSHVDDDHINGILELAVEMHEAVAARQPVRYRIGTLWHNSFDDIIGNDELPSAAAAFAQTASTDESGDFAGLGHDESKLLASVGQGRELRDEASFLDWPLNVPADGLLCAAPETGDAIDFFGPLELLVLGPMKAEITRLQKKHDAFLRQKGLGRSDPAAALAAFTDRSVANLASIVVLVRMGGKSMLLTGDARGDKVLEGLEAQGLMDQGGTLEVDILKVMHHGSDRNATKGFFEQVRARHYVFSGNGEHGNPERGCLEMLFDARPEGGFDLWFTYPLAEIDRVREEESRRPWKPELHGVASFLEQMRGQGVPFTIHAEAGGQVIPLLGAAGQTPRGACL